MHVLLVVKCNILSVRWMHLYSAFQLEFARPITTLVQLMYTLFLIIILKSILDFFAWAQVQRLLGYKLTLNQINRRQYQQSCKQPKRVMQPYINMQLYNINCEYNINVCLKVSFFNSCWSWILNGAPIKQECFLCISAAQLGMLKTKKSQPNDQIKKTEELLSIIIF